MIVWLGVGAALGQQIQVESSAPASNSNSSQHAPVPAEKASLSRTQAVVPGGGLQASGPVAETLKAKKPREVGKRWQHWFNPLAPTAPKPAEDLTVPGVSPRAWTSTVGWNPGRSAFPEGQTHEPAMALVSVTTRP